MNKLPVRQSLSFYAGDDKPLLVRWVIENGGPVDLTGYSAKMQLKIDKCGDPALEIIGIIADPLVGEILFPFTGAQKQALVIDCQTTCYSYDIELTQSGGGILTLMRGIIRIEEDVTE